MALDPLFSDVSVLCPFIDDQYSLVNRDTGEAGYSISFDTGYGSFNGAALELDGLTDYWYQTNDAVIPSGTDDFTIEAWTRIDDINNNAVNTVANLGNSTNSHGLRLSWVWTLSGVFRLEFLDEFYAATHTETVAEGEWFHWAITRESNSFNLWINGVGLASPHTSSVSFSPTQLRIGAPIWDGGSDELEGHYNELRVTLNHARYSANFTPAFEPFPRYRALIEGRVIDDAGNPAQRTVRLYNRATGELVSSAISDPAGLYTLPHMLEGVEVQIVCLDDAAGVTYADKIQRLIA